ncbi:MAG TPA: type II toxin-antitoxin system Phd/YefM family antitoxin [Longimicrobiales bacterium]|nr:type II toxin-antitoxin system Phd/YefM family antitoxin [Longimicrobiales bacterium]
MTKTMGAGEFKTHCLKLMDEVAARHTEIVITKHGKPVAKLVPVDDEVPDSFGALRGATRVLGDIVSPDHEAWANGDS